MSRASCASYAPTWTWPRPRKRRNHAATTRRPDLNLRARNVRVMQGKYAYKGRALACAAAALFAVIGFSTSALADSFTSTLANPTSNSSTPSPCALPALCTLTLGGSQSSSLGGSGTYTIVDKISGSPYQNGAKSCINLATGSTLTLQFSSGS